MSDDDPRNVVESGCAFICERARLIAERDAAIDKAALTAAANRDGVAWVEAAREDMARLQADRDTLAALLREAMAALQKIADLNGTYGPWPESKNPQWGAMAIVTAREAVKAIDAALGAKNG